MAVDKLVDSTKLNACLDAEADAIRAKTGGTSDLAFDFANDKGFADAIAAIPSGTSLPLFIKHEAITVTSDRITADTGGNARAFSEEFLPGVQGSQIGHPTILVLVENTNDSDYAAQSAVRLSGVTDGVTQTARYGLRKNRSGVDMGDSAYYFYVGAGSIVHRYIFVREEPTS